MNKSESEKVLSHIDEAKNWLDAAKTKYSQSNRVGGELNLNLAQAEVKYAWELSRHQNVTSTVQINPPRRTIKYFPAAAACFLIFLGLTGGLLYWSNRNPKSETAILTVKNSPQPIEVDRTVSEDKQIAAVSKETEKPKQAKMGTDAIVVNHVKRIKPVISGARSAERKTEAGSKIVKTEKIKAEKITNVQTPEKVVETPSHIAPETVVKAEQFTRVNKVNNADNIAKVNKSENAATVNVNPIKRDFAPKALKISMASLVIDEEALTKEASYSLKNGK
jgi:hypothetical protein